MSNVLVSDEKMEQTTVTIKGKSGKETFYVLGADNAAIRNAIKSTFGGDVGNGGDVQAKPKRKYTKKSWGGDAPAQPGS